MTLWAIAAGTAIAIAYALSPLFVVTTAGFALLLRHARRTSAADDRLMVTLLLTVAAGLRAAAVFGLFLGTDHAVVPFGTFFGDEEYFIRRSIWLSNLAIGVPISIADMRYAWDDAIETSLIQLLAVLHLMFGPSPYGVHLVSALLYIVGAYLLYLTVRPGFGRAASLLGLGALLFLPSLFAWSISALKEPLFFVVVAATVWLTVTAARGPVPARVVAALVIIPAALFAESIRAGGLVIVGSAITGGVIVAVAGPRPRLRLLLAIASLAAVIAVFSVDRVRGMVDAGVTRAAVQHWDHVHEPGHSYMLFEPSFYIRQPQPGTLTTAEVARLIIGGLAAYVIVPAPWQMISRAELAYLPEQLVWYTVVLLLPVGIWAGWRRDRLVTAILAAHVAVVVAIVAMISGNIGTLVRHRALALPCAVWLSALGLCHILRSAHGADR